MHDKTDCRLQPFQLSQNQAIKPTAGRPACQRASTVQLSLKSQISVARYPETIIADNIPRARMPALLLAILPTDELTRIVTSTILCHRLTADIECMGCVGIRQPVQRNSFGRQSDSRKGQRSSTEASIRRPTDGLYRAGYSKSY